MDKVGVVILNYLNYEDTIECIESLKKDNYDNKEIIVIDNNSKNESWIKLNKIYEKKIHLIKSEENLGFAKGNNLGIKYARNILNCSFVLLVNNDTVFKDRMLITNLINAYEPGIGVIGPRIIQANGFEQNPVPGIVTKEQVEKEYMLINKKDNIINKLKEIKVIKYFKEIKVIKYFKEKYFFLRRRNFNSYPYSYIHENVCNTELILHGSCMMLTKDYFKYYDSLFSRTFLYYEENILTLLTKKVGLKKKFINNTYIFHKEDQSSLMSFNNSDKVKSKYLKESIKVCLELFNLSYEEIKERYFNVIR